jgi:hypothetical protein
LASDFVIFVPFVVYCLDTKKRRQGAGCPAP